MKSFTEKLYHGYSQKFQIENLIVQENSRYQKILIFDNKIFGRILVLDNIVQITEKDHHSYSEMLVHFPILSNLKIENVLIIGGGDGAIATEVLKHKHIKKIELCEIDKRVIDLSKKYLKKINLNSLNNSKIKVTINDANKYIKNHKLKNYFDLVIIDRPDPVGPAKKLFEIAFYKNLKKIISDRGILIFQTGVPFFQKKELTIASKRLAKKFKYSGAYYTVVPTYVGGHMIVTWASDGINLNKKINIKKSKLYLKKISTNYYTPEIHNSSLELPPWVKKLL